MSFRLHALFVPLPWCPAEFASDGCGIDLQDTRLLPQALFGAKTDDLPHQRGSFAVCLSCVQSSPKKKWIGRLHGRRFSPRLRRLRSSLLLLHTMSSRAYYGSGSRHSETSSAFTNLPFDVRFVVYQELLRFFPCTNWKITNTLRADPNILDAMSFIRTCTLVREELGKMGGSSFTIRD